MPTTEKSTRPIGVAVGELFKKALVTHQGICYEVESIDNGGQTLLPEKDAYNRMRRKLQLFNPDFDIFLPPYPDYRPGMDPIRYAQELTRKIKIAVPKRITCKVTRELAQFRCINTTCGWFGPITLLSSKRRCPECGELVVQAPVYRWNKAKSADAAQEPNSFILQISNPPCRNHTGSKVYSKLIPRDYRTPIASLRLICPKCGQERRVVRGNYKLGLPSSSLRRKIMASQVHSSGQEDWRRLDHFGLLSDRYIDGVYYVSDVKVYQVTFGYSYETGHCYPLEGAAVGRELQTQAIVVQLRPNIYEELLEHVRQVYQHDPELFMEFVADLERLGKQHFEEDDDDLPLYNSDQLKRWVLHTLEHAFLMMLPLKTGLDTSKFAGSYDLDEDRVIIYDNEYGGIGGMNLLAEDPQLFMDYLELTRRRIEDCDCRSRCLKCLVTNYCGEVNNALNRHLAGPIFGVMTDYE